MAHSPVSAENYQLKWHSHLTNLNSSVCGLYRNDKFADVIMLPSNSNVDDCYGIPAHKIILSTCSYFFSSIFDNNPTLSNNSPMYIVMPPELSKHSISILVQYMYTGEATVSNEILNEVLKGGEILKIRGLWRNNPAQSSTSGYSEHGKISDSRTQEYTKSSKSDKKTPIKGNSSQHTPQDRALAHTSISNAQLTTTLQSPAQQHHPTLMVKKEMAIDPAVEKSTRLKAQQPLQIYTTVKNRIETPPARISENKLTGRRSFDVDTNNLLLLASQSGQLRITKENDHPRQDDNRRSSFPLSSNIMKEQQQNIREKSLTAPQTGQQSKLDIGTNDCNNIQIPEALSFLTIKEEPTEWHEFETTEAAIKDIVLGKQNALVNDPSSQQIKEEDNSQNNITDNETEDEEEFHSLTCELCSETFAMPSDWVRHIESHSEVSQNLPKKRRRFEEDADYTAALRCDLCETYFVTPAEWVRHVQNTHTETELAMSNNSELPKRTIVEVQRTPVTTTTSGEKKCSVCQKSFPSYASMVIHKRTHTGERPYFCTVKNCKKGFNVKSNLLRHVRTLHNNMLATNTAGTSDNTPSDTNSNSD